MNMREALETIKKFCEEETECDLCFLNAGGDCLIMRDSPNWWEIGAMVND